MIVKTVNLTADEINILKELLEQLLDTCVSHTEALTIETLLEKLE